MKQLSNDAYLHSSILKLSLSVSNSIKAINVIKFNNNSFTSLDYCLTFVCSRFWNESRTFQAGTVCVKKKEKKKKVKNGRSECQFLEITQILSGRKSLAAPRESERTARKEQKRKVTRGRKKQRTYQCQPPPASALRRLEERWRGWLCPRGVQELLRECPRVRGGGGSLRLRLRHPGHLHPRDSSTPST